MFFGTVDFLLFALLFFAVFYFCRTSVNSRIAAMLLFSLFFYAYWGVQYLPLLIASGLLAFIGGFLVAPERRFRKLSLIVVTLLILAPLLLFKYMGWIAQTADEALSFIGVDTNYSDQYKSLPSYFLVLPLGISFYTFQNLSYVFDVYLGRLAPASKFSRYLCYLVMFPQLIAGPIVRASEVLYQMDRVPVIGIEQRNEAWGLLSRGFFKKLVVADTLAIFVDNAFANPAAEHGALFWWLVAIAFGWQIYCDFSGYSDIAVALGLLMGYRFPVNFRHPYLATSLSEFWARWHITLSSWFRDYVYIPLGGNRCATWRHHFNLWVTLLISGVWHGAAWTFVVWAMIHALGLSAESVIFSRKAKNPSRVLKALRWSFTYALICLAWIFFRSKDLDQASSIATRMFYLETDWATDLRVLASSEIILGLLGLMVLSHSVAWIKENNVLRFSFPYQSLTHQFAWSAILAFSLCHMGSSNEFIYFQF